MKSDPHHAARLIAGFIRNTLNDDERDQLDNWVVANDRSMTLFADLSDDAVRQASLRRLEHLSDHPDLLLALVNASTHRTIRSPLKKIVIAAAIAAVLLSVIFLVHYPAQQNDPVPVVSGADLLPLPNVAVLSIDAAEPFNLTKVSRDSLDKWTGGIVIKTGTREIRYTSKATTTMAGIHRLAVYPGSRFKVTLADDTRIELNAGSELRYPAFFRGGERSVFFAGEGFFKIAKDSAHPFVVTTAAGNRITVTGTAFYLRSYPDQPAEIVTLKEGSIRLQAGLHSGNLRTGQRATVVPGHITINDRFDWGPITGWQNDLFLFSDAPITEIMDEVARWYDAAIIYRNAVSAHFNATVPRNTPVSRLLHYLEMTGQVRFTIQNKTIIVDK